MKRGSALVPLSRAQQMLDLELLQTGLQRTKGTPCTTT